MKKNYLLFFLLFLSTFELIAQKQASYWYFGDKAGLDFNSGAPQALTDGALQTAEGCATIADVKGNLLFYTDGSRVWNKNHIVMPNGNNLFGHSSSTQSAIIVPKPDDNNLYFIFTVDWANGEHGLNYYTLDMSLEGGLGDVLGVGGVPTTTNLVSAPVDEKISAVKVEDEQAFWVIAKQYDRFLVYKVEATGVNTVPVVGNDNFVSSSDSRGYLKISPDGKKLVSASMSAGTYFYDFDAVSGTVTNERLIDLEGEPGYGVEFSPLSKKLYISTGDFADFDETSLEVLYQFDVEPENLTSTQLNASRFELHRYLNQRGALQLAIDGKIYRAINETSFLGVISNPDVGGMGANYIHNAISLIGKNSRQGLPPFIQSFLAAFVEVENNCFGQETIFTIDSNESILSISWDFGDGSALDTRRSPTHRYAAIGTYELTVTIITADQTKEIIQQIEILAVPQINAMVDLFQCDDDTDGLSYFNLDEAQSLISNDPSGLLFRYFEQLSDAEEGDPAKAITNPTTYLQASNVAVYARVENAVECAEIATIQLYVTTTTLAQNTRYIAHQCDDANDGDETNGFVSFDLNVAVEELKLLFPVGQNLDVQFYENMEDGLAEVNPIDINGYTNSVERMQDLVVRVENIDNNACLGLGYYLRLQVDEIPAYEVVEAGYLCLNTSGAPAIVSVENPQGNYSYTWTNSANEIIGTEQSQDFYIPGIYSVTATNSSACGVTTSVEIKTSDLAVIEDIIIDDENEINTITVVVSGPGDYEFAIDDGDFQDDPFFDNVRSGLIIVNVRDKFGCGTESREIAIFGFPKFFTPNGDGFNDTWQIDGVNFQPSSQIFIYDRYGKLIVKVDPEGAGWNGEYRGRTMPDGDYWFNVKLQDGRLFKGHFSLIRK